MPFTDYLDQALICLVFSKTPYTIPDTLYIGLSTTAPNQEQGLAPFWNFTEPIGNAYQRVGVDNNSTTWIPALSQPTFGYKQQNGVSINFPQALGGWGTIVAFGIWDAPTGSNLLGYGSLSVQQTITTGDTASFSNGNITITAS